VKFHLLIREATNKISTKNRKSKSVYSPGGELKIIKLNLSTNSTFWHNSRLSPFLRPPSSNPPILCSNLPLSLHVAVTFLHSLSCPISLSPLSLALVISHSLSSSRSLSQHNIAKGSETATENGREPSSKKWSRDETLLSCCNWEKRMVFESIIEDLRDDGRV